MYFWLETNTEVASSGLDRPLSKLQQMKVGDPELFIGSTMERPLFKTNIYNFLFVL
jgi:hypothetical protein